MVGLSINELETFLENAPNEKTHEIIVNEHLDPNQHLIIHLMIKEVTIYFPHRKSRASEY